MGNKNFEKMNFISIRKLILGNMAVSIPTCRLGNLGSIQGVIQA